MSLTPKRIDFAEAFHEFKEIVEKIYAFSGLDKVSGMKIHQLVYDMCTARPEAKDADLFHGIADVLVDHVDGIRKDILAHNDTIDAYAKQWDQFSLASSVVDAFCAYLNKLTLKQPAVSALQERKSNVGKGKFRRQTIESLAFMLWKQEVVLKIKSSYSNRLVFNILELVTAERMGRQVTHDTAKIVITSFTQLNNYNEHPQKLYVEEFERPYLWATRQFYEREAAESIATDTISLYMKKSKARLDQEQGRNRRYCERSSYTKVIRECESQLITKYQSSIQEEFLTMITDENFDDCRLAYQLLSRIEEGVVPLLTVYENHIAKQGKGVLARLGASVAKDPREYVELLSDLHQKYTEITNRVFDNDAAFVASLDKGFRTVVNDVIVNPLAQAPEVLAKYCDVVLKKTSKLSNGEAETDDKLNRLIVLFAYIDDKDIFQKFYSRFLAKRLIYAISTSDEAEANMISRLKNVCGVEYTTKLQRMFTDMAISSDVNTTYRDSITSPGVDFSILVLTSGSWPLTQSSGTEFQLPEELGRNVTDFTKFYHAQYSGRKLTWLWHLSKGEVKLNYLDKRYELAVSLYQLAALLPFNSSERIPYKDIRELLRLSDQELRRVYHPMLELGLIKLESTRGSKPKSAWHDEDELCVNMQFVSKRTKIKISNSVQSETVQEMSATRKAVDEDRKLYLQAAIVRVMKSRQELHHNHLIQEVIEQAKSRFAPSVPMIKRCIDTLLEKAYIERSSTVRDKYLYIA